MLEMFPGQKEVVADWFTGHVIVPDGKLVNYVRMGYASTYEKYIILTVKSGVVTRNWSADTAAFIRFRDTQFAAYKKTDAYRAALDEITREEQGEEKGMSTKQKEEFLREFYSEDYMSIVFDEALEFCFIAAIEGAISKTLFASKCLVSRLTGNLGTRLHLSGRTRAIDLPNLPDGHHIKHHG
jgi:hypothetical protein